MIFRRRGRFTVAAAALTLALIGTGCAQVTSGTPGAVLSLAGYVQQDAQSTLAQKSVGMRVSGSLTTDGQEVKISGLGQMQLADYAMKLSMQMTLAGQRVSMNELLVSGKLFMSLNADGQTMKDLIGKDWAEIDIPGGVQTSSSGVGNPMQILQYAAKNGAKVVSIGSATIRGVETKGYEVTIPRSVFLPDATAKINADKGLSPDVRARALQALQAMTPPVYDVWFDQTHKLLQRMRSQMSMDLGSISFSGAIVFDFTDYGVKADIQAPPANDVAPFPGTH